MAKYRKKPVIVEAVKSADYCHRGKKRCIEFLEGKVIDLSNPITDDKFYDYCNIVSDNGGITIHTLEGNMLAKDGDYIIKGVNGEFYPCKPDVFEKTYETVY